MIETFIVVAIYIVHALLGCGAYFALTAYNTKDWVFDKKSTIARIILALIAGYVLFLTGLPDSLTALAVGYAAPSMLGKILKDKKEKLEATDFSDM